MESKFPQIVVSNSELFSIKYKYILNIVLFFLLKNYKYNVFKNYFIHQKCMVLQAVFLMQTMHG